MTIPDMDQFVAALKEIAENPEVIEADKSLDDLDVDSLGIIEWVYVLSEKYGIEVDDGFLAEVDPHLTVRQVYEKIVSVCDPG